MNTSNTHQVNINSLYALVTDQGTAMSESCLCGACLNRPNYLTVIEAVGSECRPLTGMPMTDCTSNPHLACIACGYVPAPTVAYDPGAVCGEDCHHPGLPHIADSAVHGWPENGDETCPETHPDGPVCCLRLSHDGRRHIASNDDHVIAIWATPAGIAA